MCHFSLISELGFDITDKKRWNDYSNAIIVKRKEKKREKTERIFINKSIHRLVSIRRLVRYPAFIVILVCHLIHPFYIFTTLFLVGT